MRNLRICGVLLVVLSGACTPMVRLPPPGIPVVIEEVSPRVGEGPVSGNSDVADAGPKDMNPGKVLLVVVGVFSALLVLLLILVGTDLGS
jgi:hypothetical protein